jgi:hypothetical protein
VRDYANDGSPLDVGSSCMEDMLFPGFTDQMSVLIFLNGHAHWAPCEIVFIEGGHIRCLKNTRSVSSGWATDESAWVKMKKKAASDG